MQGLTHKQQLVYDQICRSSTPQGAYHLLDSLRAEGFKAPSQVYRVLTKLLELGLIHKVESLNAFIACDQSHQAGDSILAVCDSCGSVAELPPDKLANKVRELGTSFNFEPRELRIELKGSCARCD